MTRPWPAPHIFQRLGRLLLGCSNQLAEVSSSLRVADLVVFGLIFAFGVMQFFCSERAPDFLYDDSFFADAARSILEHGYYGINGYQETNMPPGLSWIFALLCLAGKCSHTVFLRTMAVSATLGFLASYELLRRQLPRGVAAAICLLLVSSPMHFAVVTQWVVYRYPYLFTSISALLVARKFDKATNLISLLLWGTLLTALLAASLMFATVAVALIGAIVATITMTFFRDRRLALVRLRNYSAVLLVGIVVQGAWSHREQGDASAGISALEWPLPGFPQSYLSQLKVISGNYPELGMATPRDVVLRVVKNAYQRSNLLSRILLRRPLYLAWMSFLTIGILLVIVCGWCYSVWPNGGDVQEWYFAVHELIYLLWPWSLDFQFVLPVLPLACLYLWRGIEALTFAAKTKPRVLGGVLLPVGLALTASSYLWVHGSGIAAEFAHGGLQDESSFVFWLLVASLAAWLLWAGPAWRRQAETLKSWCSRLIGVSPMSSARLAQLFGTVCVFALIVVGLVMQIKIARGNLDLNSETNRLPADAQAGLWIGSHTDANAVIMAREVPMVYHNSKRKVVWFPPSSNSQLLMDGIRKHKIDFVVVVRRHYSYYLPPDDDCFDPMLVAYPDAFRLVDETPEFRIFQVAKTVDGGIRKG
jgi:hypothetical protein